MSCPGTLTIGGVDFYWTGLHFTADSVRLESYCCSVCRSEFKDEHPRLRDILAGHAAGCGGFDSSAPMEDTGASPGLKLVEN